ncbi:MAG: hypothetical protein QOK27_481 [Gemmatimonadales bacterium]|nr:hypothetical protein [Gemmatimonadales bacterium]
MRRGRGEGGKRGSGEAARWLGITLLLSAVAGIAAAQEASPPPRLPASPPESLTVYLMTMGPGKRVWERFGHNAIWIHDPVRGTDQAYNYGLFDFHQENFLLRFIQGRMWYWMQGFPAESYIQQYRRANRSVWVQELEMVPRARRELQQFLEWNERPENRFYHYDYYRDNCSTRIRDALDRALGGRIHQTTQSALTNRTYRFHTLRLTANDPPVYTGLLLALGQPVDRPISVWEEMFLPLAMREHLRELTVTGSDGAPIPLVRSERTLFEASEPTPPSTPPFWLPFYLGIGLALGGSAYGLATRTRHSRSARLGFLILTWIWVLVTGIAGAVLAGLWGLTDHAAAYYNENILQLNILALPLVWLLPGLVRGRRSSARLTLGLATAVAALSVVGLVLKLLPQFYQLNGQVIALALPAHAGVAVAVWRLTRS